MKIIIRAFVISVFIFTSNACEDYVDVVPSNIAEIEDAFATRQSAERFLAGIYSHIPSYNSQQINPALLGGDEMIITNEIGRTTFHRVFARGDHDTEFAMFSTWGNKWVNLYIPIRDCNIFLNNIDKPFDLLEEEKERWIAEVKFLKAYFHFYILKMYGPMPIVKENIPVFADTDVVSVPRDPVIDVADYIVELLDEAIADLPLTVASPQAELGRITAPAAAAIKARVLMTVASPLFNGNEQYSGFVNAEGEELISTTYDETRWARAAEACKEAIDLAHDAGHQLYQFRDPQSWSDSTRTLLTLRGSVTSPWNEEIVWGSSDDFMGDIQQTGLFPILNTEGVSNDRIARKTYTWAATYRLAEMFYTNNGVPISEDKEYNYSNRHEVHPWEESHKYYIKENAETITLNYDREPRYYSTLGFNGGLWHGHTAPSDEESFAVESLVGQRNGKMDQTQYNATGYYPKKLVHYQATFTNQGFNSEPYPFPIVRLADLYLYYAEALNEIGQLNQSHQWIDRVRNRAGLDGVVESWQQHSTDPSKPTNQSGLREIIHQERMIELALEGPRFWDIRRWKKALNYMNGPILGWNVDGSTVEDYYNLRVIDRYQFTFKHYLWPIHLDDLLESKNLIQNPGW